jgi:hypothetical protein
MGMLPKVGFIVRGTAARTLAVAFVVALAACTPRTQMERNRVATGPLPRPDVVLVHDFSVSPDEITLDTNISRRLRELTQGTTDAQELERVARAISASVTQNLVADLRSRGMNAVAAAGAPPLAGRPLSIEGQFFSINEGSERRRMIVGFGAGASEVRTLVQVFDGSGPSRLLVEDFYVNARSAPKPGMAGIGAAGEVAGRAAATAGTNSGLELLGANRQTVEADARELAKRIGAEIAKLFEQQGWTRAGGL